MTVDNILDPSALLYTLSGVLPAENKTLASPQDALSALTHAIMTALAFRLVAVDDESSPVHTQANILPIEWNRTGPRHYTFRYKHDQSSLEFTVTLSKLGGRTLINAIAAESDRASSIDLSTNDFTSSSFFPQDIGESGTPLVHGFISSNRVTDFVSQFKLKILQNIIPGLGKDGYTESSEVTGRPAVSIGTSRSIPQQPTIQPGHPRPRTPLTEPGQPFSLPSHIHPSNPLEIGRRDLDPFVGHSPFAPPPLFPNNSRDGMLVGPDHPLFGGRVGGSSQGIPGGRGPWGGDGFLPPMGAPPGARFDPVGPGLGHLPGRGGNSGPRNHQDPGNDEFMPPGYNDMFM